MNNEAEWIEWNGGECPVPSHRIDVTHKDGDIIINTALGENGAIDWSDYGMAGQITAYRIHNAFEGAPDWANYLCMFDSDTKGWAQDVPEKGVKVAFDFDKEPFGCLLPLDWKIIATRAKPNRALTETEAFDSALNKSTTLVHGGVMASDILTAAAKHQQDRAATYDKDGERSIPSTVDAFNAVTGHCLTHEQGWLFMCLLKLVRSQQGDYKDDNYEDLAAYSAILGEPAAKDRA
jgi:hypothetical protein